jgi:WD40 repeat protein
LPFPGHEFAVLAVAFSPDGETLASRGGDHTIRLWDVHTGEERRRLETAARHFIYRDFERNGSLTLAPNGRTLVAASPYYGKTVHCWDAITGKETFELALRGGQAISLALSPDGRTVACATFGGVELWSTETGKLARVLDFQHGMGKRYLCESAVAFSPDGTTLASGADDNSIRLWDWTTGSLLRRLQVPDRRISYLAFSPDGNILAEYGGTAPGQASDGALRLWEVATGTAIHQFELQRHAVPCVAFSPDGVLLAGAGGDQKIVRLWNVFTGQELPAFAGHAGAVLAVAFGPDGHTLASASADTTLLLWDLHGLNPEPPGTHTSPQGLQKLWAALSSRDSPTAYRAIFSLVRMRDPALAFLKEHLEPIPGADPQRVQRLLVDLDDEQPSTRETATRELAQYAEVIEPELRRALARNPSPEARRRVEALLAGAKSFPGSKEGLRGLRAIQVLEGIGSARAREVLEKLSRGAPSAGQTRAAKAALERLNRRRGKL